jgi:four helix bundle protein
VKERGSRIEDSDGARGGVKYRDLLVWQRSLALAERVFRLSAEFPPAQRFVLATQMQRAAASVPANIAEGHGRKSTPAFANHLSIAAGSLYELETHVQLAERLGLVAASEASALLAESDEIGRMLSALRSKLRRA